jgi:hypothetical protein
MLQPVCRQYLLTQAFIPHLLLRLVCITRQNYNARALTSRACAAGELAPVAKACSGAPALTWDSCAGGWRCRAFDECVLKGEGVAQCRPRAREAAWPAAKRVVCGAPSPLARLRAACVHV